MILTGAPPTAGITKYAYDSENNLTKITDALLRDTQFHYDALGHVTQTQFPSGLTEDYTYDQLGNLKTKTDRKRNQTTYNYDSMDRLKSKVYNDSTEVDYTYDNDNRLKTVGGTAANGSYTLTYDNPGRLTQTDSAYSFLPSKTWTVQYGYDAASNRSSMTDPQSASTTYVYDTLNRLQTLTSPAGSFGFTYDALGRRLTLTRPVRTSYTYDNLSRLLSVTTTPQRGFGAARAYTYTYDAAGNRLSRADSRAGTTSNYGYDNIYQLTSTTGGSTEAYTYDLVGNRLTSTGVPNYTVNSSNQLTSTSNATYTYDNNGNTLTKVDSTGTTSYTWDFENRLTSVVLPASGGTVSFVYDPFGRRIKKSSSSATSVYVYDGADQLQEVDSTGTTIVARYTMGPGIDQPLAETVGGSNWFYETDGLGSVVSVMDFNGVAYNTGNTYTYDSFGKQIASTGVVANPFRYTGREFDSETGLMYYRARYYDPAIGRFLSEDDFRFLANDDFYGYVHNNSPNRVDPTGRQEATAVGCTLGGPVGCGIGGAVDVGWWIVVGGAALILGNTPQNNDWLGPYGSPILNYHSNKAKRKCANNGCKPCIPPVGTIAYRLDLTGDPHRNVPPPHWKLYVMKQNPSNCRCFWDDIEDNQGGFGPGVPPSGTTPIAPPAGGGR